MGMINTRVIGDRHDCLIGSSRSIEGSELGNNSDNTSKCRGFLFLRVLSENKGVVKGNLGISQLWLYQR